MKDKYAKQKAYFRNQQHEKGSKNESSLTRQKESPMHEESYGTYSFSIFDFHQNKKQISLLIRYS